MGSFCLNESQKSTSPIAPHTEDWTKWGECSTTCAGGVKLPCWQNWDRIAPIQLTKTSDFARRSRSIAEAAIADGALRESFLCIPSFHHQLSTQAKNAKEPLRTRRSATSRPDSLAVFMPLSMARYVQRCQACPTARSQDVIPYCVMQGQVFILQSQDCVLADWSNWKACTASQPLQVEREQTYSM